MARRSFLDTNVLIYAVDRADPAKQEMALGLIARHAKERTGVISPQVLQEYFSTAKCTEIISEDHAGGQLIRGITIINPFR